MISLLLIGSFCFRLSGTHNQQEYYITFFAFFLVPEKVFIYLDFPFPFPPLRVSISLHFLFAAPILPRFCQKDVMPCTSDLRRTCWQPSPFSFFDSSWLLSTSFDTVFPRLCAQADGSDSARASPHHRRYIFLRFFTHKAAQKKKM